MGAAALGKRPKAPQGCVLRLYSLLDMTHVFHHLCYACRHDTFRARLWLKRATAGCRCPPFSRCRFQQAGPFLRQRKTISTGRPSFVTEARTRAFRVLAPSKRTIILCAGVLALRTGTALHCIASLPAFSAQASLQALGHLARSCTKTLGMQCAPSQESAAHHGWTGRAFCLAGTHRTKIS